VTHSSHIFTIETHVRNYDVTHCEPLHLKPFVQANYVIQLIKPIIEGKLSSVDVTTEATDAYNAKLEDRLSRSVFINCLSWFHPTPDSKVNAFPGNFLASRWFQQLIKSISGPHFLLWWWLRWPNWNHFQLVGRISDDLGNGLARSLKFGLGIGLVILSVAGACLALSF
jgi:hypothetical protein